MKALDLALIWAERGIPCFPIAIAWDNTKSSTNKRPLTSHGHKDATTDIPELRALFDRARLRTDEVLAVGVYPAPASLVVIDIDRKGGVDGFDAADNLGLRDSFGVSTPSGGEHRYFRLPEGVRIGNKSPWAGIDVRSADGWVVAPGCETPWGAWEPLPDHVWPDDLDDIPDAVLELLDQRTPKSVRVGTDVVPTTRSGATGSTEAALAACLALGARVNRKVSFEGRDTFEVIRPGKDAGVSATVGRAGVGIVNVFSTDWPGLPAGGYTEHDGKLLNYHQADAVAMEAWVRHCTVQSVSVTSAAPRNGGQRKQSQASQLIEMALERYTLGRDTEGEVFAVAKHGPNIAMGLRDGGLGLRSLLAALYFEQHGAGVTQAALTDALITLEGIGRRSPETEVHLRVGRGPAGEIVLDLGHADGRVVIIEPGRWYITDRSPIYFLRTKLTRPIPTPTRGGNLDELRDSMNVSDKAWGQIQGWMVATFFPDIDHPILALMGEQGTGKSTIARMITMLLDPSPATKCSQPRNIQDWAVTASLSRVVHLDNVSSIPSWFSDPLCQAATGGALLVRRLYSNRDVEVLEMRGCVIMTSIDAGSIKGDLADRFLKLTLARISSTNRCDPSDLERNFEAQRPSMLGCLLDLVAAALEIRDQVRPAELPRMAGYGKLLAAIDATQGSTLLAGYIGQADELAQDFVEGNAVANALFELAQQGPWSGTATELGVKIAPREIPKGWPRGPRAMSAAITKCAPALRTMGVSVERVQPGRIIYVTLLEPDAKR